MNKNVVWRGKQVKAEVRAAAIEALKDATEYILDESNQLAPIDEGTLIRSGSTDIDRQSLTASVSYDTKYAIRQHEDLKLKHLNGRKAKFLEQAIRNNTARIRKFIVDRIKGALA